MTTTLLYALTGVLLFSLGAHGVAARRGFLRKLLGLNVAGAGVFMVLIARAFRGSATPDPVPHAMVLTGIVVAISATAFGVALARRAARTPDDPKAGS